MADAAPDATEARIVVVLLAISLAFAGGLLYPWLADLGPILSATGLIGWAAVHRLGWSAGLEARAVPLLQRPTSARVVLCATALVTVVGGLEYTTQIALRLGWVEPYRAMETLVPEGTDDYRAAHITADRRREPDPVLWWRPKAQPPYTAQRMKGPLATVPKPAGTFRILCYGDSNTDGPAEGSWPEELHHRLRRAKGVRIEVLNAGVAGYSSHQGLLRFLEDVDRYEPDLVLVSFGWNDATTVHGAPDHAYRPPPPTLTALQRLLIRFDFYRTLLHLPRLRRGSPERPAYRGPRVPIDRYLGNLSAFLTNARASGANIVFLTRPFRQPANGAPNATWVSQVARYNRALREFGAAAGAPVVDVQRDLAARRSDWFADTSHLNRSGRRKLAAFLEERLLSAGLLPTGPE